MTRRASRIASTLDLRPDAAFEERADVIRSRADKGVVGQLTVLGRILVAAARRRPLVLYSSWGSLKPDLLACVVMSLWPARSVPPIVLVGEMWQPSRGRRAALERLLVRRADKVVGRYLVPSQSEADLLPRNWPVTPSKTQACPFYFFPRQHDLTRPVDMTDGHYVFAAGDSFRDYAPLLQAARRLPAVQFHIASMCFGRDDARLPDNVTIHEVRLAGYPPLVAGAAAVVVPLDRTVSRSAGLLSYLMAMWMAKPVIVSDAVAVREYVEDGATGLVVDGSVESYQRAICWVLDAANEAEVRRMRTEAHLRVDSTYTWDRYVARILHALDDVAAAHRT